MPMMAMKVSGCPVRSSEGVMPQKTNGKHSRMSSTLRQLLNSSSRMARIRKIVSGRYFIRLPIASPCSSPSPTQRIV